VLLAAYLLVIVATQAAAAEQKRHITEKDLFQFTWAADPQISPDGSRIVFVRVAVNSEKDEYETALWMVSTQEAQLQQLTNGPHDTGPCWSPDGSRLVFLRSPEKDGKPEPAQLYLLRFSGGEPRALTSLPKGAGSPAWSPDGKTLAFISTTSPKDLAKAAESGAGAAPAKEAKPDKKKEHESDVRVITKAVYRLNDAGYIDPKHPSHIWTQTVPTSAESPAKPKQLTSGEFNEAGPVWAPDGSRIYFVSTRNREPYYQIRQSELYSVPAGGGQITKVAGIEGSISNPSVSKDGKRITFHGFLGQPVRSYRPPHLFVAASAPGAPPRDLTASYGYDVGAGLAGDQHPPRGAGGSAPVWSADGKTVIDRVAQRGTANLELFDANSAKVASLTRGDQEVVSFSASAGSSKLALLISTPTNIGDLFICDAADGSLKQLTHVNQKLFSPLDLTPPEELSYASFDGKQIQGWIQKPPDFDAHKKYPLILNIHGGPHAAYGYTFDHEFQWMAAKGYVVLYPNPRGSSSYGEEFGNIIQYHYPGDDYKDLMAGVDELIRRGYIDPQRLGVTGGSGGGLLTNWVITQTDRFAAAASQRSIGDWAAWWYSADFTLFQPNWFRAAPFQEPADYVARSPITYIDRVKTPLMLIEGEADYRTPPGAGGETMFRALKYLKRPVVMVRFPGESHELSRSGKPWHRVERLEHIVNWFDKYLLKKPMPQYDVQAEEREASLQEP
jgi:dipeptidyl aminopeptidase/acylaminoacyl peptidase